MYASIFMYTYVPVHTYIHVVYMYIYTSIYTSIQYVCMCVYRHMCLHSIDTVRVYTLLYRYIYTLAIVHTHLNIHQYLCVRTWTHRLPDQLTNCDKKEVAH